MHVRTRKLEQKDLPAYLELLGTVELIEEIPRSEQWGIYRGIHESCHRFVFVAVDEEKIVGTIALSLEQTFTNGGTKRAFISDLIIDPGFEMEKIGKKLIEQATHQAKAHSCFDIVTSCEQKHVGLFAQCTFKSRDRVVMGRHLISTGKK